MGRRQTNPFKLMGTKLKKQATNAARQCVYETLWKEKAPKEKRKVRVD